MFWIDKWYILLVLPALLLSMWAQHKVNSTFRQYSGLHNARGMTGAQAARQILDDHGLHHIAVARTGGELTDHYDPKEQVIRLSNSTYASTSVAAVGVAAHEAGHAVQHATGYAPLRLRTAIVPATRIGSQISPFLLLAAALYLRSSRRLYDWLLAHPHLGTYIRNFRENKAIPLRVKIISVSLVWSTLLYCTFAIAEQLWLKILSFMPLINLYTCLIINKLC